MTRGFAVVLTLIVLSAAWSAAWLSTRQTDYFPSTLQSIFADCALPYWGRDRQQAMDDFTDGWFSGVLSDFQEPSLRQLPPDTVRSVRFTWIRSFHDPIVIRVDTLAKGGQRLTAKQHPQGAGYPLDRGIDRPRQQVRMLSAAEVEGLTEVLRKTRLLELQSQACQTGLDGAQWIVEGIDRKQGYRFRDFQSPEKGPEREFGLFMLGLTGWDVEPIY